MREQAKKMNVTSLRAEDDGTRAEIKIAKVRNIVGLNQNNTFNHVSFSESRHSYLIPNAEIRIYQKPRYKNEVTNQVC